MNSDYDITNSEAVLVKGCLDKNARIRELETHNASLANRLHLAAECLAKAAERNGLDEFTRRLEVFLEAK